MWPSSYSIYRFAYCTGFWTVNQLKIASKGHFLSVQYGFETKYVHIGGIIADLGRKFENHS
jgi:hypothetical protein